MCHTVAVCVGAAPHIFKLFFKLSREEFRTFFFAFEQFDFDSFEKFFKSSRNVMNNIVISSEFTIAFIIIIERNACFCFQRMPIIYAFKEIVKRMTF